MISAEPAWFCRRRAHCTDHCGVTRGRRHETSPTTVSCTRKLMDPTPPPEHTTAKKREAQSTLFHERDTDSLIRAPPGNHTSCCHRPGGEPHHERTDDSKTKDREPRARSNCQHRRTAPRKMPQDLNAAAASPAVTKEEKVQRSHQPTKTATQTKQPWPFSKKKQPQHTKAPIRTQKEGNKPHAPRSRNCISVTGDDPHAEPEEPKA